MLIDIKSYSSQLKKLWQEVFGDSEDYINLLLESDYEPSECFAFLFEGEVLSALYLLKCEILFNGRIYKGRYLYAAATDFAHRKKGLMSDLLREAQCYCEKEAVDFISLVPANDGLYDYYGRYGFKEAMYKNICKSFSDGDNKSTDRVITSSEGLAEMRDMFDDNKFSFCADELNYALSCLNFSGLSVYINSKDSYYISDEKKTLIHEFVSSKESLNDNAQLLFSKLKKGTAVISPYDLSGFGESKKARYGMIYPINKDLNCEWDFNKIYMNLALD